ncbi:MAG: DUF5125 domain-containing protein [Bacteroides sp.]|nr:DUF5125 domain-containing protein [Bacteroides sp.]
MKQFMKTSSLILLGLFSCFMMSCEDEEGKTVPQILETEIVQSAEFGDSISFKVKVVDSNQVQSVTASIYYEGTEGSRTTLREGADGIYEGRLYVPALSDVANGDYEVMFLALNNVSGHSEVTKTISCSHNEYDYVELVATDGQTYRFNRSASVRAAGLLQYELTGTFPGQLSGYFRSPAPSATEYANGKRQLTWGAEGSKIVAGSTSPITLISSDEEVVKNITLKFNQVSIKAEVPLLPSTFKLNSDGKAITKNLKRGQTIYFEGLPEDCWIDVDFFKKADDGYTFLSEDGSYKVTREDNHGYIRVERMSGSDYASYDGGSKNEAIWCIGGDRFGKPNKENTVGWDTNKGLCMSKIADDTYQLTIKLYYGLGFKFFWQKGWGGEFKRANYALVQSDFFGSKEAGDMEQMDGDTVLATKLTSDDKWYRITLDVSGGPNAVKLTCVELSDEEL